MDKKHSCLCQIINIVLLCSRYIFILPVKSIKPKNNHLNVGCTFRVSKLWYSISIVVQLFFVVYTLTTTFLRYLRGPLSEINKFEWYLMTISYSIMQIDILISLCFGTFKAKRIGKLFERISRLNGIVVQIKSNYLKIKFLLIIILTCCLLLISSYSYVAYTRLSEFNSVNLLNFIDSPLGVIIRGIINIASQIQCALVVTLCLLISSIFQHVAATIKSTLEFSSHDQTKIFRKNKPYTIKWMNTETNNSLNIVHLEKICEQYQEAIYCLSEMNDCFGIQLLVTFTALLVSTVYYLFRTIELDSNENYVTNHQQRFHCIIAIALNLTKLVLYISMGQKINSQSKEPIKEMQCVKVYSLPIQSQQQIQSLLMQWLSIEPCYLSAYNVIDIGPWLLGPIIGNVITYFLVALQYKYNP